MKVEPNNSLNESDGMNDRQLQEQLATLNICLADGVVAQLADYRQELLRQNERMNLTRHLDMESFVTRDVLDSYQLAQCLRPHETVLDVGTGGGVPGIILEMLRPDLKISLAESVGKKARAVSEMVEVLGRPITVYAARAEEVVAEQAFNVLVARAVGPLSRVLKWFSPHWSHIDRLLLIKGPKWVAERGDARHLGLLHGLNLRKLTAYETPGHFGESVVLGVSTDLTQLQASDA